MPSAFWFVAFAAGFGIAALFHLVALADPRVAGPSPPWRHALFAAINAGAAVGMVRRPRGFVAALAILCTQQLYSHGAALLATWHGEHRIDWASVVVLCSMPVALVLVARDAWRPSGDAPS